MGASHSASVRVDHLSALTTPRSQRTGRQKALTTPRTAAGRATAAQIVTDEGFDNDDIEMVPEFRGVNQTDAELWVEWRAKHPQLVAQLDDMRHKMCCCFVAAPKSRGRPDYARLTEGLPSERQPRGVRWNR